MNNFNFCFLASGEAPTFSSKLKPLKVIKGDDIKLKVQISGYPAPMVTWYQEGRELESTYPCNITTTDDSSTLIIKDSELLMSGTYSVKLSKKLGSAENSVDVVVVGKGIIYFIFERFQISKILRISSSTKLAILALSHFRIHFPRKIGN